VALAEHAQLSLQLKRELRANGEKVFWRALLFSPPTFESVTRGVLIEMSDPRNVAHKKKVTQEKHHKEAKPAAKSAKGKKSPDAPQNQSTEAAPISTDTGGTKGEQHPGDFEKSLAVLSKLKDMEFHSRANIETLAQLSLTVEEELKQREFAEGIGAIYSAQDAFHAKIAAFIETYHAKCESLK
jgi:hypothetical protein